MTNEEYKARVDNVLESFDEDSKAKVMSVHVSLLLVRERSEEWEKKAKLILKTVQNSRPMLEAVFELVQIERERFVEAIVQ